MPELRTCSLVVALSVPALACTPKVGLSRVTLETGVSLEYAEIDRGDEPVIFLHGYTDSWFSYSEVLERLPAPYHGYALSQRGHGDSDRPPIGYAMVDFAGDVAAFMDAQAIDRATIVGHSMGSVVAQRFAIDYPERTEALVLIGASARPGNEAVLGLAGFIEAELRDPIDPAFVTEFQTGTLARPVAEEFLATVVSESLELPARVWKAALAELVVVDYRGELGRITAPTLILWGDRDATFSRADQDELAAGIPDARLRVLPGHGHGVHWEDPSRVVAELVEFLQ